MPENGKEPNNNTNNNIIFYLAVKLTYFVRKLQWAYKASVLLTTAAL